MNKYTQSHKENETNKIGKVNKLESLSGPADEIDALCRQKLPDGAITHGLLAGHEAEIRQEALIMCLAGYLEGRPKYRMARDHGNHEAMSSEMARCVSYTLDICKKRLGTMLSASNSRHVPLDERNGGLCLHPYNGDIADWPFSARVEIVLRAADQAVRTEKTSALNAGLLGMVVSKGMSVEEISRIRKVSPSAIYQRLRRINQVLPELIHQLDPKHINPHEKI
ncbi:MAG: hypothetical protein KDN05_00660 [Verrucomicrobiae bacterium]|nr:hypothetical protein [Verrucomicrobiae bacterium]MCP5532296.1 hypothetical protein [Akkermansiaceae bacterium]